MLMVCGEAMMDVFAEHDTPTGTALDARIGGSPMNVAIGLARLGQPVAFLGALSRGFLGDRLRQALEAEGVGLAHAAMRRRADDAEPRRSRRQWQYLFARGGS